MKKPSQPQPATDEHAVTRRRLARLLAVGAVRAAKRPDEPAEQERADQGGATDALAG